MKESDEKYHEKFPDKRLIGKNRGECQKLGERKVWEYFKKDGVKFIKLPTPLWRQIVDGELKRSIMNFYSGYKDQYQRLPQYQGLKKRRDFKRRDEVLSSEIRSKVTDKQMNVLIKADLAKEKRKRKPKGLPDGMLISEDNIHFVECKSYKPTYESRFLNKNEINMFRSLRNGFTIYLAAYNGYDVEVIEYNPVEDRWGYQFLKERKKDALNTASEKKR